LDISFNGTQILSLFNSTSFPQGYAAVLDCGATRTVLPRALHSALVDAINAVELSTGDFYFDCVTARTGFMLDFRLGDANGPVISVPLAQFAVDNGYLVFPNGDRACWLNFEIGADTDLLLGATVLKRAYAVFNLDGLEVLIGQPNFANAGTSSLIAITASTGLPGVVSTATGAVTAAGVQSLIGPIALTSPVGSVSSTLQAAGSNTALQAATATTSKAHQGMAAGSNAYSSSIVGSVTAFATALLGLLGGSMLILV
jgi:Eukaryotic aspartyl protease